MARKLVLLVGLLSCGVSSLDLHFPLDGDGPLFDNLLPNAIRGNGDQRIELSKECSEDLLHVVRSLGNESWAREMIDSAGKLPSGILKGNLNSLGQFDECINVVSTNSPRRFKGKYCMIQFPLGGLLGTSSEIIHPEMNQQTPKVGNINMYGIIFNVAVCIPNSCKGSEIESLVKNILDDDQGSKIIIDDDLCSTADGIPLDASDWVAIGIFSFIGLLLLMSTLFDAYLRLKDKNRNTYFLMFSLWTNTERLVKTNPGSMKCLNGIRAITMFWIILGHRYCVEIFFPRTSIVDIFKWGETYGSMMILGGTLGVDTFLFLSGMLLSYVFFKRNKPINLFIFYLHRILRLTPALAAIVLIMATLFRHLGNGPFWPAMIDFLASGCRVNWWLTLLYVHNYVNTPKMCPGHTWYLGVDMQLFLLSPILLIPLRKSRKYGLINFAFWFLVAVTTLITIVFLNKWPAAPYPFFEGSQTRETGYYIPTHMRAVTWMIGFAFGYWFYSIKDRQIRINKFSVVILWLTCLTIMSAVIFGMYPLQLLSHKFNHLEDSTYNCFARSGWVLAVAWIVFACAQGYAGPVNWFLSWRIWEIIGRLSYTMYLFHLPLQSWIITLRRDVSKFSHISILYNYCGDLFLTIIVAYFATMAFESPVSVLEKLLFHREKPKPKIEEAISDASKIKE